MTPLEAKITALLVDCEDTMEPYAFTAEKWVIVNKTQKQIITVIDEKTSLAISFGKTSEIIKSLKSYKAANKSFDRDIVFSSAAKMAGHWGTFDGIFQYLLTSTCKITPSTITFNHSNAILKLKQLREVFSKKHVMYVASTRLIGCKATLKHMELPDEVDMHRLSIKEQNEKQPIIQRFYSSGINDIGIADKSLELQLPITVPVDNLQENSFFKSQQEALQSAKHIFNHILDSILISLNGKAILGQIELHGGVDQIPIGQPLQQEIPPHTNINIKKNDLANISIAYDLLSGGKKGDKTLSRALHRFLLGRRRTDLVDKLVDYVISWEALLLTQEGSAIAQELSYRFSLNGASLISSTDAKLDRFIINTKMKAAYSARSTIIHGGGDADINKVLTKGDFTNLQSLCDYLEANFRSSLFWLAKLKPNERPYRKHNGWEELIWSS